MKTCDQCSYTHNHANNARCQRCKQPLALVYPSGGVEAIRLGLTPLQPKESR